MATGTEQEVRVGGRTLKLTNLEKQLYPSGFSKAQVIDYYSRISPALLPHLRGRALTLKRYPHGSDKPFFYEKNAPKGRPDWIETIRVRDNQYLMVDDLPALTYVANLAALELHTPLGLAASPELATAVAFDLDPGPPADVIACAQVALALRDVLAPLKLRAYPKTSGNKGMQIYVPIEPTHFDATKTFAHAIARLLEERLPTQVVSQMPKALRHGKVFIDWSQNVPSKTTICVYSLRARESPLASTPLRWEEVEQAAKRGDPAKLAFEAHQVLERFEAHGDLFAEVVRGKQHLPKLES